MKKFYLVFFTLPILACTLLYLSPWWFIGGLAAVMVFIAYQFYIVRLNASESRIEVLENDIDDLNARLEISVLREQKTSKEVAQIREMKQQLLSAISHEIRTPMNGVMGMSLLLTDTPLTKEQTEYVDMIRSCSEGLLTTVNNLLVNDMLDFSKLQQEGKQLEYKNFHLRDAIEEVIGIFAGKTAKDVDLVYDIDTNVPEQIIGDNKRLRQVLMNLVENAVKFTRHGEVFLGVQYALPRDGQSPVLNFEIRDTGNGIAKDQLKQLFKGIHTGRELQKGSESESGLGLVICKKLVELMGGTIEVKSEQGTGSSFSFSLPVTPSLKALPRHARYDSMIHLHGKRILVVDNNPTVLATLLKQLKSWKMLPAGAGTGSQALDMLSKQPEFDVILTDIDMPETNGIQLANNIRKQYPFLPVIGLTVAGDSMGEEETSLFASLVAKPAKQLILLDKLLDLFLPAVVHTENSLASIFAERYPLRILVAEDNPVNQKIASKILTKLGYTPAIANHGKEVMEMVDHEQYDVILMDVQMPQMNGLEATRMIRTCLEIQPVIIALTANAMHGDRDECRQAGMDDYMSKPIDLTELLKQLEKWAIVLRDRKNSSYKNGLEK